MLKRMEVQTNGHTVLISLIQKNATIRFVFVYMDGWEGRTRAVPLGSLMVGIEITRKISKVGCYIRNVNTVCEHL